MNENVFMIYLGPYIIRTHPSDFISLEHTRRNLYKEVTGKVVRNFGDNLKQHKHSVPLSPLRLVHVCLLCSSFRF